MMAVVCSLTAVSGHGRRRGMSQRKQVFYAVLKDTIWGKAAFCKSYFCLYKKFARRRNASRICQNNNSLVKK